MSAPSCCCVSTARLRGEPVGAAVVGALERHPVVVDLRFEREDLESARIGERQPVPTGELRKSPELGDRLGARPHHQVVGVAEHDLGAERVVVVGAEVLDRPASTDRHEQRSRVRAVRRGGRCRRGPTRRSRRSRTMTGCTTSEATEPRCAHPAISAAAARASGQEGSRCATVQQHRIAEAEEAVVAGGAPRRTALRQRSPTKASIIISSVVRGRWKLVISRSTTCQSNPRWMKMSVRPSSSPRAAADSSARTDVVPTATTRSASVTAFERLGRHPVALGVHAMCQRVVLGDRAERVEADDELDLGLLDTGLRQPIEQFVGEVQSGGRRRSATRLTGVDRLVAIGVGQALGDVRRQRHLAVLRQQFERVDGAEQRDGERVAGVGARADLDDRCAVGSEQHLARLRACAPVERAPPTRFRSPSSGSSIKTSALPPVARTSGSRAGITLVSLTTSRSPGRRISANSLTCRCSGAARPRSTSRRAASRGAIGV